MQLQRAIKLVDEIILSNQADARNVRALARLLASQWRERMRLMMSGERVVKQLQQQLEQARAHADESRKLSTQLQKKLNALTEIERTLPVRPVAPAAPAPADAAERRPAE